MFIVILLPSYLIPFHYIYIFLFFFCFLTISFIHLFNLITKLFAYLCRDIEMHAFIDRISLSLHIHLNLFFHYNDAADDYDDANDLISAFFFFYIYSSLLLFLSFIIVLLFKV